ncbi:hypothetical protein F5Y17DRAFT_420564 [Xylariaceae sp. FL0594]|nr:hypothetical protein F5Y17DRAFT_420564 [Xylariaceae sp. FL0594]
MSPPDISFPPASLEFVPGVGSESDNYSSGSLSSSEDLHFGFSPRPKLPLGLVGRATAGASRPPIRPRHHPSSSSQDRFGLAPGANGNKTHYEDRYSFSSSLPEEDLAGVEDKAGGLGQMRRPTSRDGKSRRSSLLNFVNQFHSKRAQTRIMREILDKADRDFVDAAHALVSECPDLHRLQQLHDSLQRARLQYREAEAQLDEVVEKLPLGQGNSTPEPTPLSDREELELRQGKVHHSIEPGRLTPSELSDEGGTGTDKIVGTALRGITGDRPEAIYPLFEKLRAAFAQLQLAKETLINTQLQRDAYLDQKSQAVTEDTLELLEQYGDAGKRKAEELRQTTVLTKEDKEELRIYNELEKRSRRNIQIYTDKVRSLRQACKQNGEMPSYSYLKEDIYGFESLPREEVIPLPSGPARSKDRPPTLAHVFPLLLSNPAHVLHEFPLTVLQWLNLARRMGLMHQAREAEREIFMHSLLWTVESDDKSEAINRWLLHKLFHTAMEAETLRAIFQTWLTIYDMNGWQQDVLRFWFRDGTANSQAFVTGGSIIYSESCEPGADVGRRSIKTSSTDSDSGAVFKAIPHSDSGQLEGIRDYLLTDSWPDRE